MFLTVSESVGVSVTPVSVSVSRFIIHCISQYISHTVYQSYSVSVVHCISQSLYRAVNVPVTQCTTQSVFQSAYQLVSISVSVSIRVSVNLSANVSNSQFNCQCVAFRCTKSLTSMAKVVLSILWWYRYTMNRTNVPRLFQTMLASEAENMVRQLTGPWTTLLAGKYLYIVT